ncbi:MULTISPECIES: Cof-type HAD-IIB family hydrolase [Erwinia]|uniref:Cof-type HAD-IIB family hydrolase n=1 Tax=Erwinia TaxID=551 RepID=UPI00055436B8|nr:MULTISPECIES: Cof-type HAD-IIB family hydrolase [Erwinia]
MSIKLIATDMDGTFLDGNHQYNRSRFREQYQQMQQRGIKFVVASGNQYYQLKSFFDDIDVDIAYVAENGAYLVDKQQELYCGEISTGQVQQVTLCLDQTEGIETVICGAESAYLLDSCSERFFNIMQRYYHRLRKVSDYGQISDRIFKFALGYREDDVGPLMAELDGRLTGIVTPVSSGHGSVDLIIPGNHKANGLKKIQQIYGIRDDEVLAFGDGGNDLEMLRQAGYGFAMDNASPAAKAAAKYRAPGNGEQGVLQIIDDCLAGRHPF